MGKQRGRLKARVRLVNLYGTLKVDLRLLTAVSEVQWRLEPVYDLYASAYCVKNGRGTLM
jgi:hypothetical protein